jgi:hypothetical protein
MIDRERHPWASWTERHATWFKLVFLLCVYDPICSTIRHHFAAWARASSLPLLTTAKIPFPRYRSGGTERTLPLLWAVLPRTWARTERRSAGLFCSLHPPIYLIAVTQPGRRGCAPHVMAVATRKGSRRESLAIALALGTFACRPTMQPSPLGLACVNPQRGPAFLLSIDRKTSGAPPTSPSPSPSPPLHQPPLRRYQFAIPCLP